MMETLEKNKKSNNIVLKKETIDYLRDISKSYSDIENVCYYSNEKDLDIIFRKATNNILNRRNQLQKRQIEYFIQLLVENYIVCKSEKFLSDHFKNIF